MLPDTTLPLPGSLMARAPWYRSKAQPSTADMTAKLRRVLIAARFKPSRPDQPTREEIHAIRLAWANAAA
jgi:hypothetical protein